MTESSPQEPLKLRPTLITAGCVLILMQRQRYWGKPNACDNGGKWLYWRIFSWA